MKIVAIVNHKGGVGKTTTAVCLSGALVEQGKRILLIDLDPQASASKWLERDDTGRALVETLLDDGDLLVLISFRVVSSLQALTEMRGVSQAENFFSVKPSNACQRMRWILYSLIVLRV